MKSIFATPLYHVYKLPSCKTQSLIRTIIYKLEGGEFYSSTLRRIFRDYHGIDVGMYTHGGCFDPANVQSNTSIGRYCSIARTARFVTHNHPGEFLSTHAYFFNPSLGFCDQWNVDVSPLSIGHDVWIGEYAVVLPRVTTIGHGAIISAGAIVSKDIPPYAVAVGNPARIVRYRFSEALIASLLKSKWWEKELHELKSVADQFQVPYQVLWDEMDKKPSEEGLKAKQLA